MPQIFSLQAQLALDCIAFWEVSLSDSDLCYAEWTGKSKDIFGETAAFGILTRLSTRSVLVEFKTNEVGENHLMFFIII